MARLAFDPGELSHATRHGTSADPIGIRLEPSLCQLAAQKFLPTAPTLGYGLFGM